MKLITVGKIQIGIGLFFFVAILLINILVYSFGIQEVERRSETLQQFTVHQVTGASEDTKKIMIMSMVNTLYNIGGIALLFAEILIATDIIILILISILVIDGATLLSKD